MILDQWREVADGLPVNPFYRKAAQLLPPRASVLDAGAGAGQGALFLRELGHDVTALEPDHGMAETLRSHGLRVVEAPFSGIPDEEFAAVLCVFSLFFEDAVHFPASWGRLVGAVGSGGIWGGQFLGDRDEWVGAQPVIGFSRAAIEELLADFEILDWEEVERRGRTAWGAEKDWHIHHIIARRR